MRCPTLLFAAVCVSVAQAQCEGNLFVNGDLDAVEAAYTAAPGWFIGDGSPDLNDEIGPLVITSSHIWMSQPIASPTGGTWQNIGHPEGISQVVPTVPGTTYTICFNYAQQPIMLPDSTYLLDGPFAVRIQVNGPHRIHRPVHYGQLRMEKRLWSVRSEYRLLYDHVPWRTWN